MRSRAFKLDELPIEIVRRIASVGACEAALALSKVNKTLHAACHDTLIYKAIINNRNGNGGSEWNHNLPLSIESPVSSWARYALADSLAPHGNISSVTPRSTISWAPQLLVYHHPSVNLADTFHLARALVKPNQTGAGEHDYALAFCFALRLMSEEPASLEERAGKDLMLDLQSLHRPTDAYDHYAACSPGMLVRKSIQAFITVGLFASNLREDREIGRISAPNSLMTQTGTVSVPTSTSIPFHSMMDVPLPFSPDAAICFASCHLAKMTTLDFLEDDEWAGFYTMPQSRNNSMSFDPPMHGIHFCDGLWSDDRNTQHLEGWGEDAIGGFELEGKLAPETGQLLMKKSYCGGFPVWHWVCIMTPVGIVGSWIEEGVYGGAMWLWKTSWTADHHA